MISFGVWTMVSLRVRTGGWVGACRNQKTKTKQKTIVLWLFLDRLLAWLGLVRALPVWLFFTAAAFHSL